MNLNLCITIGHGISYRVPSKYLQKSFSSSHVLENYTEKQINKFIFILNYLNLFLSFDKNITSFIATKLDSIDQNKFLKNTQLALKYKV